METGTTGSATKRAAINGLAVVGFLALIFLGVALAIYAARFVPLAVGNLGSAAVYFSSVFSGENTDAKLEAVQNETVIPFTDEEGVVAGETDDTEEEVPETPTTPVEAPEALRPSTPASTPSSATTGTYVIGTRPVSEAPAPYGLPDLTVTITERGYLETGSSASYVKADEVPDGKRGAIKFVVENKGTNVSGEWKFTAKVPTTPSYTFTSPFQNSINPGSRIEYVLGFDRAKSGESQRITITVDSNEKVEESNEDNNDDTETLVIN
jgi:hypothetical protein